jgi:hypothetical protein
MRLIEYLVSYFATSWRLQAGVDLTGPPFAVIACSRGESAECFGCPILVYRVRHQQPAGFKPDTVKVCKCLYGQHVSRQRDWSCGVEVTLKCFVGCYRHLRLM